MREKETDRETETKRETETRDRQGKERDRESMYR